MNTEIYLPSLYIAGVANSLRFVYKHIRDM